MSLGQLILECEEFFYELLENMCILFSGEFLIRHIISDRFL